MGFCGHAWALNGANGPHTDYRPGYASDNCGGTNAACHVITQGSFLPQTLDNTLGYTPANENFTNFCLSCHNKTGEAHRKSVGTPSNNIYDNRTGLIPGNNGVSHSWKGLIGNARTRAPTEPFFNRTAYMPHGVVACQTCHNAPIQDSNEWIDWMQATNPNNDQLNYTVLGYASTPQYLNQYLRVYRSAVALTSPPTFRRDRKQYLVSPSEYTYNNSNATITFSAPQGSSNVYVELGEPYLRGSNAGNALCLDCHNDRNSQQVSHAPGTGATNNHPVAVNYGYNSGLHDTLKPYTSSHGNAYIENGQVLCTSCHDPHNAASNNGQILRETDGYTLCADCHKTRLSGYSTAGSVNIHNGVEHTKNNEPATVCTDCHGHNSNNILLIKNVINGKRVNFRSFTGLGSFGPDTGYGVCEVCHTKTSHHLSSNASSGQGHNTGKDCTRCHKHQTGFAPQGGTAPCYGCHDGSAAPNIKALMGLGTSATAGGKVSRHFIAYDNNTSSSCLAMCHTSNHAGGSPNLKTPDELSLCLTCHNGGTGTTTQGRSINVAGNFATSLHNYTTTVDDDYGLFKYAGDCTKCHLPHGSDSYPNLRQTINGRATNGDSQELCFGCHNSGMSRGAPDIEDLWKANPSNHGHYDYAAGQQMQCVKCHSPHGSKNDKMIQDSLGGPGLTRDAICRACHSGSGSVYNVMGNKPGSYGNFSAASMHQFGLNVAIGGRTVDLTCSGCHNPHNTRNARLLQDKVVFSGYSVVTVPTVTAVVQPQGPITSYGDGWTSYCTICHTSLKDTGGQSPYRRHPVDLPPPVFYPHTSGFGMAQLPLNQAGDVTCITCHYTHGSPKPDLERIQDANTPENHLCLQCHYDKDKFLLSTTVSGWQESGAHGGFVVNQGRCTYCHDMHTKGNERLLQESTESVLCERCHAVGGMSKYTVWKPITSLNPSAWKGTAGSFGDYSDLRGGTAPSMHNINEENTPAPGGVTTQHRCGTCHNPHGSPNYRILRTTVNNVTGLAVYANTDSNGKFINYSSGFVKFCTACHTSYKVTDDGNGNWIRHPVGVSLNNYSAQDYNYSNSTSYNPKVELESGKKIACVSCHYAHGSSQNANLKFPGGRTVNLCKTCHSETFNAGVPGAHAGYTGDNGTCSDCHSMHQDGNPKLLKGKTDTEICVRCHDHPGYSDTFQPPSTNMSHLDVWKGNVFGSPTSWFGTAGSFGTYDPVNGGTATSMHPINSSGAVIAPGDGATLVRCGTCHDTHGSTNYRLLKTSLNGKSGISVSANVDSYGRTISYNGGMSSFCSACHVAYLQYGSAAGYTRHPVDVALTAQEMANYSHFNGQKYLPLEGGNRVTCTTCHFAHGSPNMHLLKLPTPQLCQTCHSKGLDPSNGYAQVMNTHGGFTGNNGNCSVCHSMHTANNRKLLIYAEETDLCYSCHGPDGANRASFPNAPIVWKGDEPPTPGAWDGTAGSFGAFNNPTTGGSIASHHMIDKTDSPAPGGTTTTHHCGTCHDPHGNDNYRLLRPDVNGASGISVAATTDANGKKVYISGISSFCVACHTAYAQIGGTGGDGYQRHPVSLPGAPQSLSAQEMTNLSTSTYEPKAQVESGGVMCLSCHFAHGSPSYKMLRMQSYTSSQSELCQQCHKKGYNAQGAEVINKHGGFVGNNANCGVCHSVHAKDNNYLLLEPKEASLCEDCHSGAQKFQEFKAQNPFVVINAPSRFNVFSSAGNSFGNYSVGGGGVVSWHKVDGGAYQAPGGITIALRCGVCHNPHGEDNYVMLRSAIPMANATGIKVFGTVSSASATAFNTYSSGFAKFCSACHTRLTSCGSGSPWTRHPVDFRLQSTELHNWSTTTISPRVPVESGTRVTCITCHNSHGSKNFNLQRLGGNGMCQQCHKR